MYNPSTPRQETMLIRVCRRLALDVSGREGSQVLREHGLKELVECLPKPVQNPATCLLAVANISCLLSITVSSVSIHRMMYGTD